MGITQDEEILHLARNYRIPKRKKYCSWLGITQDEEILDLAGNYPRVRNTGPGWKSPKRKKYWTWLEITQE
jgi:hypothetical protein